MVVLCRNAEAVEDVDDELRTYMVRIEVRESGVGVYVSCWLSM